MNNNIYYKKYLKYKLKYTNLKMQKAGNLCNTNNCSIIPKGTILYRTSKYKCDRKDNLLEDKYGMKFSTKAIIPISISLECNELTDIEVYEVNEDIQNVYINEYNEENKDYKDYIAPGKIPIEKILNNYNNKEKDLLPEHILDGLNCLGNSEIFITEKSMKKITLLDIFKFNENKIKNSNDLLIYIKENFFPFYLYTYIKDGILVKY